MLVSLSLVECTRSFTCIFVRLQISHIPTRCYQGLADVIYVEYFIEFCLLVLSLNVPLKREFSVVFLFNLCFSFSFKINLLLVLTSNDLNRIGLYPLCNKKNSRTPQEFSKLQLQRHAVRLNYIITSVWRLFKWKPRLESRLFEKKKQLIE